MQKYNTINSTSNAHKPHTSERNITANSKHKQHKSYYLKPLGRITIASLFLILAVLCGMIFPQAAEGSVSY